MAHSPGQFTARYRSGAGQPAAPGRIVDLTAAAPLGLSPTLASRPAVGLRSPPPCRPTSSPSSSPGAPQRKSYTATSTFPRRADTAPKDASTTTLCRAVTDHRAPKAPLPLSPKEPNRPPAPSSPGLGAASPTSARAVGRAFQERQPSPSSPVERQQSPALRSSRSSLHRSTSAGSPTTPGSPAGDNWWDRLMAHDSISSGGGSLTSRRVQRSATPLSPQTARARVAIPRSPTAPQVARLADASSPHRHLSHDSSSLMEDSPGARSTEGFPRTPVSSDTHDLPLISARTVRPCHAEAQLVVADNSLHVACPKCQAAFGTGDAAPLVLHCGHSMCRSCCVSAVHNDEVRCQACGAATTLDGRGAAALQTNYAVRAIHAVALHSLLGRQGTVDFLEEIGANCLVCLEVYSDTIVPHILACGHSICQACCARKLDVCPLCNTALQGVCPNKVLLKALEALVAVKRHGLDPTIIATL